MVNYDNVILEYNLQFFAQDGPGGEKTEPATQKKLDDARKDGKVAKSKELITAISLMAFFLLLKIYVNTLGQSFIGVFTETYGKMGDVVSDSKLEFSTSSAMNILFYGLLKMVVILLPILLVAIVVAIGANIFQVKWMITTKPLEPKFDKFNPINGLKRIFSFNTIFELIKNILMIIVIVYMTYSFLKDKYMYIFTLYEMTLEQAISTIGGLVIDLGIRISAVFLVIGLADYIYQKMKFNKDMRMTKQEIKDEYKQSEGDPQVKGQRKQKMREASRRRMMSNLSKADVVITNPTHFAVALQYDAQIAPAPVVVAKGADFLALQIREKAKELEIEIVENKPLARMLYNNVDIDEQIPQELYQAVADILVKVYSIKNVQY